MTLKFIKQKLRIKKWLKKKKEVDMPKKQKRGRD